MKVSWWMNKIQRIESSELIFNLCKLIFSIVGHVIITIHLKAKHYFIQYKYLGYKF